MSHQEPSFSFDLYPGLDAELEAAFARNIEGGTANPEIVAAAGLQAAIAETVAKQDPRAEIDVSPEFQTAFDSACEASTELFGRYTGITAGELSAGSFHFKELDWHKVSRAYEVMEATGLRPEVVVAPQGENIKFWKDVFAKLPGTKNKGLYIDKDIEKHWSELNDSDDQLWAIRVVPAGPSPAAQGVPHSMTKPDLHSVFGDEVAEALGLGSVSAVSDTFPDLRTYLTMQALRLEHGQEPLDAKTYTWLKGTFDNGKKAPYADWRPGDGQVIVYWVEPDDRDDDLGVRPAVRG